MKRGITKRLELVESTLKAIENANKMVIDSFLISQWLIIHQGNDCY